MVNEVPNMFYNSPEFIKRQLMVSSEKMRATFLKKKNDKFGKNLKSQTGIETFHFMFSKLKQKE